jgi:uncharacterized tellurite resistance protein B-like protein
MFLFHLTPLERTAFVALARQLVAADGGEGPAEAAALGRLEVELGLPLEDIAAAPPTPELLRTFASRSSRGAALLELLALAYADGVPHPDEMELLKTIAEGLKISELRLLEMEHWVVQQLPLSAQAEAFLTADE